MSRLRRYPLRRFILKIVIFGPRPWAVMVPTTFAPSTSGVPMRGSPSPPTRSTSASSTGSPTAPVELLDADRVARRDPDLLATGANHGVHQDSSRSSERRQYRAFRFHVKHFGQPPPARRPRAAERSPGRRRSRRRPRAAPRGPRLPRRLGAARPPSASAAARGLRGLGRGGSGSARRRRLRLRLRSRGAFSLPALGPPARPARARPAGPRRAPSPRTAPGAGPGGRGSRSRGRALRRARPRPCGRVPSSISATCGFTVTAIWRPQKRGRSLRISRSTL